MTNETQIQRPAAEQLHADELERLIKDDHGNAKPAGWVLSPDAVVKFILGDPAANISKKFVGTRRFVERCVVALATNRGLMLIGEPGTAKSYLSELLSAAISGDSTLTIQGSAGTTEDDIKYSWNYALLLAEGPSDRSMVPAPLFNGMKDGKIVRFEEITRCPLEIQDTLLSILSDRVMMIPEFEEDRATLFSRTGFNVIATANTRDRGVNEMSAALKRRFNFETVHPIGSIDVEKELVQRETNEMLERSGIPMSIKPDMTEVLVTTFNELRNGRTLGGKSLEQVSTVMSTAEAVVVAYSAATHAYYFNGGALQPGHIIQNLIGSALKENKEDLKKIRHYFNHVVKARKGAAWKQFYKESQELDTFKGDD